MMKCRICENSENLKSFEVREMMFGLRDQFTYFQCPACGCLQIAEVPSDMSKYYPSEYYSFDFVPGKEFSMRSLLKKRRDIYAVSGRGFMGWILDRLFPDDILKVYSGIPFDFRILDVGCGTGTLIYRLKEAGFKNILGIDPYNSRPIKYDNGLIIEKMPLSEITGLRDLITYHHSFEHIDAPQAELVKVRELLSENGTCIIRLPVADSWAWEHYKTDWVQIDAPRHFFLYSINSLKMLAEKAGLCIEKVEYDSTAFQFWGSEQYKKDIPLTGEGSYQINRKASIFKVAEIIRFERMAQELNIDRQGDQAIFYLRIRN